MYRYMHTMSSAHQGASLAASNLRHSASCQPQKYIFYRRGWIPGPASNRAVTLQHKLFLLCDTLPIIVYLIYLYSCLFQSHATTAISTLSQARLNIFMFNGRTSEAFLPRLRHKTPREFGSMRSTPMRFSCEDYGNPRRGLMSSFPSMLLPCSFGCSFAPLRRLKSRFYSGRL